MARRKLSEEQERCREASEREWQRRDYERQLAERLQRKLDTAALRPATPSKRRKSVESEPDPVVNA